MIVRMIKKPFTAPMRPTMGEIRTRLAAQAPTQLKTPIAKALRDERDHR